MNIFTALSQGKGRLNEENLSAMLGFLLSPTKSHGFRDIFLQRFLKVVAEASGNNDRFADVLGRGSLIHADVLLEYPYKLTDKKRRVIDIEIRIYEDALTADDTQTAELHRILIENKIRSSAADPTQLREEFEAVIQHVESDETQITMVFLTPSGNSSKLTEEYENLSLDLLGEHKKAWLYWVDDNDNDHVVKLLRGLLKSELEAEIPPMSEYVRHTIKAFIVHISDNITESIKKKRRSTDIGAVRETVTVRTDNGVYRIDRYESGTIRTFDVGKELEQELSPTKPILRQLNEEMSLDVDLFAATGKEKITRTMGQHIMKAIVDQGKEYAG